MKLTFLKIFGALVAVIVFSLNPCQLQAQEESTVPEKKVEKPVRSPFEAGMLIETQTHVVWPKKTLEFVIQHRFGKLNSGTFDLIGLYAPSNIRMGLNYGLFKNAQIGIGTTKNSKLQDLNWKYKILTQTRSNSMPVGLAYYGNVVYDAREDASFGFEYKSSYRMSYFNQLILARKFSSKITVQVSASHAHFNQIDTSIVDMVELKHDNFGIGLAGRFKFSPQGSVMLEYDHPLTSPDNVKPNLSLGLEFATSGHAFQLFVTTYDKISPQRNMMYNTNDFTSGDMLIGFNITRNWNL